MSFWIELHCDAHLSDECVGQTHDYPMGRYRTVRAGSKALRQTADEKGWKVKRGVLHCPACLRAALKGGNDAK